MGDKPAVTLTLAGDEANLTRAFDRVGASSREMSDKVESSSKDMTNAGKRFDGLAEHTDEAERRSMGFKDSLDGLTSGLSVLGDSSLSTTDKLMGLGQAGADLFGGITNFLLPALGNLATFLAGPLRAAMTFISSHPLLIILGLITLAVIYLISQTDWFQQVATRVFNWVGNLVKTVFHASINFVVGLWQNLVAFVEDLPARIGRAFAGLGGIIAAAFKAGLNFAIELLNRGIDVINRLIYGVNLINPFGDIPNIPHIPRLHTGGVFHAEGGRGEGLALLRDGERVSAPGQGGGGGGPYQISVPLVQQIQAWFTDGTLVLEGR